jgi:hypothetical protein
MDKPSMILKGGRFMKTKTRAIILILSLALILCAGTVNCFAQEKEVAVVSYGLCVLAAQTDVAVSSPIGNDVVFSADCFARGLNLPKVSYVTVRSLPDPTKGELLLGSTRVAVGQTVSGENLSFLTFSPTLSVTTCSSPFSGA